MSKARQNIAPRSAVPAPKPAQRELVINVNKTLLFTVSLILGAVLMLGGGFLVGQVVFRPRQAAAPAAPAQANVDSASLPGGLSQVPPGAPSGVQVKPANPDPNAPHPNLEGYLPVSLKAVPLAKGAPRIEITNVDEKGTLNMGDVKKGEKREYNFDFKNVGEGDLIINQMYTSCGCTIATFAGRQVTDDPFDPPVIVKPGQSMPLKVTYDTTALDDKGYVDKFVQIFTNDPTGKDIQQPYRETRFRLTGNVVE